MVRPLYPRKRASEPDAEASLWKNPYLLSAGVGIFVLATLITLHFLGITGKRGTVQPGQKNAQGKTGGDFFSFVKKSGLWKEKAPDSEMDELAAIGIPTSSSQIFANAKVENYRDKRRLFALQKYQGTRQLAEEKEERIKEFQKRRSSPTALALKDAVDALSDSDNLGIMKLETLLNEELMKTGGKSENLDVLIFAFQNLGDTYKKKNMQEKAKGAYLHAFQLMKERAPAEQGPQWDEAISEFQKAVVKGPGN